MKKLIRAGNGSKGFPTGNAEQGMGDLSRSNSGRSVILSPILDNPSISREEYLSLCDDHHSCYVQMNRSQVDRIKSPIVNIASQYNGSVKMGKYSPWFVQISFDSTQKAKEFRRILETSEELNIMLENARYVMDELIESN